MASNSDIIIIIVIFSFPLSSTFLIEGVLGSKNLFRKLMGDNIRDRGRLLSGPRKTLWGPLAAILDFAGGECVPLALLGWYLIQMFNYVCVGVCKFRQCLEYSAFLWLHNL